MAPSANPLARRGSFSLRVMDRPSAPSQPEVALAAAGQMVLLLPIIQMLLLVGVLKAEPWQVLLGLEGLLMAWLARSQYRRVTREGKIAGFGIAILNAVAMGIAGIALGGHLLWLTGAAGMAAVAWLTFRPTGGRTIGHAWLGYSGSLLLVTLLCIACRAALELSSGGSEPAARARMLGFAWTGYHLRGGSGTERALLRLRQAQAAFEAADYSAAFAFAHDGAMNEKGGSRVPATAVGEGLLDSLLRVKAQAHYNGTWEKNDGITTAIGPEPLPAETLADPTVRVRWGW